MELKRFESTIEEMEAVIAPMGITYHRVRVDGIGYVYQWDVIL